MSLNFELDNPTMQMEFRARKKEVAIIFSSKDDAEKFWIAYKEGARLGAIITLKVGVHK